MNGLNTHQVVNAQQKSLDAAAAVSVSAQVNPQQLGEELQREAAQTVLWAPVQLEQLMTHRLQQLWTQTTHDVFLDSFLMVK